MLGDYRLVKTLGVGAFGKVKRESSLAKLGVLHPLLLHVSPSAGNPQPYYFSHAVQQHTWYSIPLGLFFLRSLPSTIFYVFCKCQRTWGTARTHGLRWPPPPLKPSSLA